MSTATPPPREPGMVAHRTPGLRIRATPTARAAECLVELVGAPNVRATDDAFHLTVEPKRAAAINAQLVRAGIRASELSRHELGATTSDEESQSS